MATGCVKILKKAHEFDYLGEFIPPHKRGPDINLFRGKQKLYYLLDDSKQLPLK